RGAFRVKGVFPPPRGGMGKKNGGGARRVFWVLGAAPGGGGPGGGGGGVGGDAAEAHLTGELRVERIAHVVLAQLAGAETRRIQVLVVGAEGDLGDQRRARFEGLGRG